MDFSLILRACGNTQCIIKGRAIHGKIITSGFRPDVYMSNHLLSMYLRCKRIVDAEKVFDTMCNRNLVSWTALMSGYSRMNMAKEALRCFKFMVNNGFSPNNYTYTAALTACATLADARAGKEIHGKVLRLEHDLSTRISNCLVSMYGKCGFLKMAQSVFDAILEPDYVSWTSILTCYCQYGGNVEALNIFVCSRKVSVAVNEFASASILGACADLENLEVGMQVHSLIIKCGIELDSFIVTALINFYAKCGDLGSARKVFVDVNQPQLQAWTALIGGYAQQGKRREAIDIFREFYSIGIRPNERTLSSVLGGFTDAVEIEVGEQLHTSIIKMGFSSFTFVGNAILNFYSKSGLLEQSLKIFYELEECDIVSWNALIGGHMRSGKYDESTELLKKMLFQGFDPNHHTYAIILNLCGDIPATEWGKQTHCCILKPGLISNVVVSSALVDMYAKCGRLGDARKTFDNLVVKNMVSWNTMLTGYAHHGFGKEALEIYSMMLDCGMKPNELTFLGVLVACGHVGLVEEGWRSFNSMVRDYCIAPGMEHIASVVSLFARKGQTKRAYEFIRSLKTEPDKVVWRCLLSGCKATADFSLGRYALEKILSIDPEDASAHIMLSNISAESKMWDLTAKVRSIMKDKELRKEKGYSWTELKNKIYYFSSTNCPKYEETKIIEVLNGLIVHLFEAGYVCDTIYGLECGE